MGVSVLQPSFSGGEMAPSLAARVDQARYQTSLKTCKNFLVMSSGGARNRPGTTYVGPVLGNLDSRLIRFRFSISDACVLVFTNLKMRVIRNGAYVLNSSGPNVGQPFELTTPYQGSDLDQLNFTQSADVMTFVHTSYRPRELKRFANDNWTLTEATYLPSIATPTGATATASTGTGVTQTWRYQITAVFDDGNSIEESLPDTSNAVTVYNSDVVANINWTDVSGATYYNIYKDNTGGGVYGFAGRSTVNTFTDRNIAATKTDTPPSGADPFVGAGNYPGAVGYFQQRKVYGGTLNNPQTSYFSRTGVFNNYGYSTPTKDDDAITWTMASLEVNRILNFLPLRDSLMVFTSGAEWSIQGTTSGFTAKTINGSPQSYNGSGYVPPLVLNDTALYLQGRGQAVSALNYSLESDGLASDDITVWSNHLLRDYSITSWAYQKLPDSIVWSVRSDGKFLGLTYMRAQQVAAWHQHETDGNVESIACVPEGQEDVVYMVVGRNVGGNTIRYVERMQTRQLPLIAGTTDRDPAQAYFVDCGLSYQGWNTTVTTMAVSDGIEWEYPEVMTLTASASYFVADDVGRQIHFRVPGSSEVVRFDITAYASGTSVSAVPTGLVPEALRDQSTTGWAKALRHFAGLDHLEGRSVAILADGNVVSENGVDDQPVLLVVDGGAVTLPSHAAVAHIGLPYVSDLETLRINVAGQETLNDKHKAVSSISVILEESRGVFAGKDADSLFELKQRAYEPLDSPTDMFTGVAKILITSDWDSQGEILIRQVDPLPVTILGIIPELTVAGRK